MLMYPAPTELLEHEQAALRAVGQFERGGTMYYTLRKITEKLAATYHGTIIYFKLIGLPPYEGWTFDNLTGTTVRAYDQYGGYVYFEINQLKWIVL